MLVPWNNRQDSSRYRVEPAWVCEMGTVHQGGRARDVELHKQRRSCVSPKWLTVNVFGLWFCFGLNVTVPWFFLLGVRNSLTCFDFTGALFQETLAILERLWTLERDFGHFKETELLQYWNIKDCGTFKAILFLYFYINIWSWCGGKWERKGYSHSDAFVSAWQGVGCPGWFCQLATNLDVAGKRES